MRFQEKVVIVTGAARGIGYAIAHQFALEGAHVFVNDLERDTVDFAVAKIRQEGGNAYPLQADVANESDIEHAVSTVLTKFSRIDILVNNAGIMVRMPTEELPFAQWRRGMAINIDGVFLWSQQVAVRSMIPLRLGSIVNVASLAGLVAIPNAATYVASKHAVVGLTKALAIEWGRYGIRVNATCPGMTLTDLSKKDQAINPGMFIERAKRIPLGHPAETVEQASPVLFLASEEASSITGAVLNIDGGNLAMASGSSLPWAR